MTLNAAPDAPHRILPIFYAPDQVLFLLEHHPVPTFEDELFRNILSRLRERVRIPLDLTFEPILLHSPERLLNFHFSRTHNDGVDFSIYPVRIGYPQAHSEDLSLANFSAETRLEIEKPRFQHVADVVSGINDYLRLSLNERDPLPSEGELLRRVRVSPNWLLGGAQTGHLITGGPGTLPEPATLPDVEKYPGFDANTFLKDYPASSEAGKQAHVFILDTVPPLVGNGGTLQSAYEQLRTQGPVGHPLHQLVDRTGSALPGIPPGQTWSSDGGRLEIIPAAELGTKEELAVLGGKIGNESSYILHGNYWPVDNHGLFIAGIIRSIAPDAPIHLLETLNPYGLGTLSSLLVSFQCIQDFIHTNPDARIVINCSMTFGILTDDDCKTVHREFPEANNYLTAMTEYREESVDFLQTVCTIFDPQTAFMVAAAGNESRPGEAPKETRFPAKFGDVAGVGAMQSDGSRAVYSNYADEPVQGGVMVSGGDIQPATATSSADPPPELGDKAIIGVYVGEFPDRKHPFETQPPPLTPAQPYYARWAGTSFAAAIISGLIAELYARCVDVGLQSIYQNNIQGTAKSKTSEQESVVNVPLL